MPYGLPCCRELLRYESNFILFNHPWKLCGSNFYCCICWENAYLDFWLLWRILMIDRTVNRWSCLDFTSSLLHLRYSNVCTANFCFLYCFRILCWFWRLFIFPIIRFAHYVTDFRFFFTSNSKILSWRIMVFRHPWIIYRLILLFFRWWETTCAVFSCNCSTLKSFRS